ncbi:uncharacterized protein LOC129049053 isoform X2 [Pongo abelii]|uniref:uncharacterized protein LOC129049053 isoform X2 n=1 Tax=Pongo abelii TaxID=9601 RepID=UPI0023E7D0CF|nr:uncharacterized protein LOC129049053 isoform X2 [Pongo abelii]
MEPETSALSRLSPDLHPSPAAFHEINTEFSEESIIYSDLKVHCSSNIQNGKITKTLKTKVSPWCIAAVIFAFLYLIALVIVAAMVAKIHCLEEILNTATIETAHCNIISQNKEKETGSPRTAHH